MVRRCRVEGHPRSWSNFARLVDGEAVVLLFALLHNMEEQASLAGEQIVGCAETSALWWCSIVALMSGSEA